MEEDFLDLLDARTQGQVTVQWISNIQLSGSSKFKQLHSALRQDTESSQHRSEPEFVTPTQQSIYQYVTPTNSVALSSLINISNSSNDKSKVYNGFWFFFPIDMLPGFCHCKTGYAGEHCSRCALGYTGYPDCLPCNCSVEGSANIDPCVGLCVCKVWISNSCEP